MNEIRQGQLYWLEFGAAAGSAPSERHPCVVVQNDVFNRSAIRTTVVCLIYFESKEREAPGNVLLKKGEANLPNPSVVNVSQILTVDKDELVDCVGKLSTAAGESMRDGLHLLFDRL